MSGAVEYPLEKAVAQRPIGSQQRKYGAATPKPAQNARKTRFERRYGLRRITTREAVRYCGCKGIKQVDEESNSGNIELIKKDRNGRGFASGFQKCGAPLVCPVCFGKVRQKKAVEIQELVQAHRERGGMIYEQVLTLPHWKFDKLEDLFSIASACWDRVIKHRRFRKIKTGFKHYTSITTDLGKRKDVPVSGSFGVSQVRAIEVTYGDNGWHVHMHVLWFFEREPFAAELDKFNQHVIDKWCDVSVESGQGKINPRLFDLRPIKDEQALSKYISKAVYDTTRTDNKHSNYTNGYQGGRQPFEILDGAIAGNEDDLKLWREWEKATKGLKSLTISPSLRKAYKKDEPEKTDKELAAEEDEQAKDYTRVPSGSVEFWGRVGIQWHMYELVKYLSPGDFLDLTITQLADRKDYWNQHWNERGPTVERIRGNVEYILKCCQDSAELGINTTYSFNKWEWSELQA